MPATIFSILCRVPASWWPPGVVVAGVELNRLATGVVEEVVEAMAAAMAPCMACRANWALSSKGLKPENSWPPPPGPPRPGGGAIEYGGRNWGSKCWETGGFEKTWVMMVTKIWATVSRDFKGWSYFNIIITVSTAPRWWLTVCKPIFIFS